jgi:type II secretory pathway pseudopilin PulG
VTPPHAFRAKNQHGFTLLEALIGVFVFVIIAVGVYQSYVSVNGLTRLSRQKIVAIALANEQLEIVRNLPYDDVGIPGSVPSGKVPRTQSLTRSNTVYQVVTTIRNIDEPFDGTAGGAPPDTAPADNKLVEIEVSCSSCQSFAPFSVTTTVAPKGLESLGNNGVLVVKAIDANGQAVSGASVHVENQRESPALTIDDTTDNSGELRVVGVPPGAEAYEVAVTKGGYSTDKTYARTPQNPNPVKPHATVTTGSVTQLTFAIDHLSTLNVASVLDTCVPVDSISFGMTGAKLIGTSPDLPKYDEDHSTGVGRTFTIEDLEWDDYAIGLSSAAYDLFGSVPHLPLSLPPNAATQLKLVVSEKDPLMLLVTVHDTAQLPVADASVTLEKSGFSETKATGRGSLRQTDWSGGPGQQAFIDVRKYFSQDGHLADASPAGDLKLQSGSSAGELTSSTFDTGSPSNFHQILWQPTNQPPEAGADSVRFQIATNDDQVTWNYVGPDGTANTFYTLQNQNIADIHDNQRYLRYKLLLRTNAPAFTPTVSDASFTFTSECVPPGQASFTGLSSGSYTLTISKAGYQTVVGTVNVSAGWQEHAALLSPQS